MNPGPVQSNLPGSPNKHDPDFWNDKIPAGFIAHPSDLDGLILYLASNQAHDTSPEALSLLMVEFPGGGKS